MPRPSMLHAVSLCAAMWLASPAAAQEVVSSDATAANDANSPLTPTIMLSVHNYYIPSLNELPDRDADVTLFRGLLPHLTLGKPQPLRFTLPEIGRAHVWTPVTTSQLVCRLLLDNNKHHTLRLLSFVSHKHT